MLDEMDKRIKSLEAEVALLNIKARALLMVCMQQSKELTAVTTLLEELTVAAVTDNKPDDMMASLASEIQRARKSPLN
jgi:hypothetical protein